MVDTRRNVADQTAVGLSEACSMNGIRQENSYPVFEEIGFLLQAFFCV